jgi:hypothetical protein
MTMEHPEADLVRLDGTKELVYTEPDRTFRYHDEHSTIFYEPVTLMARLCFLVRSDRRLWMA